MEVVTFITAKGIFINQCLVERMISLFMRIPWTKKTQYIFLNQLVIVLFVLRYNVITLSKARCNSNFHLVLIVSNLLDYG